MDSIPENISTLGERNVTFNVENNEDCPGYLSGKGNKLGLVIIQEWWGLNKSITITADRFSKEGFVSLVPDLYRGKVAKDTEEAGHLCSGLDFANAIRDIVAAGNYLQKEHNVEKVFLLGFCMGGALSIATLASSKIFNKGVAFYGVPDLTKYELKNISVPLLAHFGEKDDIEGFSDPKTARKLEEEAQKVGLDFTLHLWEGAKHAFMNQDAPLKYEPEIAEQAFKESVDFLKK